MLNRFALSFVLVCAALTACTNNRSDDFSNLKNHVYQKILIDANQDQRPVVLNQVQREADGKELPVRMGLQQALSLLQKGEWQTVDYPISNSYDKGNPYSPFHDNLDFKGFYHPPLYDAGDRWVLEKGADVNASIEFWLAMDAIDRIHTRQVEHNYMRSRIGSVLPAQNAYGRKIHSYKMTYPDSVEGLTNLLNDLLEYGVDRKTAMIASHLCVNRAFVGTMRKHEPEYFKIAEKYQFTGNNSFLSEQEKDSRIKAVHDYYGGFGGPLTGGSPRDCDKIRDLITKDDRSPFWGDLYFEKGRFIRRLGKLPNQVVTTIRFDEPKLDVGLWQHLVNKDLYQDLGRVREEGLFSGLLYPDKAKFVVITSKKCVSKCQKTLRAGIGILPIIIH